MTNPITHYKPLPNDSPYVFMLTQPPPPPPPTPRVTVHLQDEGEPWKTLKWVLLVVVVIVISVGIHGGFVTW